MGPWAEAVPHLSKRLGIPYVEASVKGTPVFFEFDLAKARTVLGFNPQYDIIRMIDNAIAFRGGEDIGILATD